MELSGQDVNLATPWAKLLSKLFSDPGLTKPVYGVLQNLEQMIKDDSAAGNPRYAGIAKILKAYTFSQLVDVFGDVPFQ